MGAACLCYYIYIKYMYYYIRHEWKICRNVDIKMTADDMQERRTKDEM